MPRRATLLFAVLLLSLSSGVAHALQGGPIAEPSPGASSSAAPAPSSTTNGRPARGPAVRERAGRRSRGGSAGSGAMFLAVLVGAMGYYVVKKLRR